MTAESRESLHARASHAPPCHFCLDESGIALPVALGVLFVVAGLATVTARASIVANHQIVPRHQREARDPGGVRRRSGAPLPDQPAAAGRRAVRGQDALDGALSPCPSRRTAGASRRPRISATAPPTRRGSPPRPTHRQRTAAGAAQDRLDRDGQRHEAADRADHQRRDRRTAVPARLRGHQPLIGRLRQQRPDHERRPGLQRQHDAAEQRRGLRAGDTGPEQDAHRCTTARVCAAASRPTPASRTSSSSRSTVGDTATATTTRASRLPISGTGSPADSCTSCDKISWNPVTRSLI